MLPNRELESTFFFFFFFKKGWSARPHYLHNCKVLHKVIRVQIENKKEKKNFKEKKNNTK